MIRSHTIRNAIEKPELKAVPASQAIPPAPPEDNVLANAILDLGKSNEENARILSEAISKLGKTETKESPKQWIFEVERETDIHDPNYGLMKRFIATAI